MWSHDHDGRGRGGGGSRVHGYSQTCALHLLTLSSHKFPIDPSFPKYPLSENLKVIYLISARILQKCSPLIGDPRMGSLRRHDDDDDGNILDPWILGCWRCWKGDESVKDTVIINYTWEKNNNNKTDSGQWESNEKRWLGLWASSTTIV